MGTVMKPMAILLAVALVFSTMPGAGGSLFAADKASDVTYAEFLLVKPGALTGKVLYTGGESPAAEVPVRVWSTTQEKFAYNTTTDEKGAYKLPELASDRYVVVYADRVGVDLRVDEKAKVAALPLNVVVPRGKALSGAEGMAGAVWGIGGLEGGTVLTSLLIVGGAAVTAVGVVVAVGGFGGGGHHRTIVSP